MSKWWRHCARGTGLSLLFGFAVTTSAFAAPQLVRSFGTHGSLPGQLHAPRAIAVDRGHVYVLDSGNARVSIFDTDGRFIRQWGSGGGNPGQFIVPADIAVVNDIVFVADEFNHRVQAFSELGTFLGVHEWPLNRYITSVERGPFGLLFILNAGLTGAKVEVWLAGSAAAPMSYQMEFNLQSALPDHNSPWHLAAGQDDRLYVTWSSEQIVQVYTMGGEFLYQFGPSGNAEQRFDYPFGIAAGPAGNLFISTHPHRVCVYSPAGEALESWSFRETLIPSAGEVTYDAATGYLFVVEQDESVVHEYALPVGVQPATWGAMKQRFR